MEDMQDCVPELPLWKSNLVSLSTFYRTSGLRTKELRSILPNMSRFPRHHEVRFAQHLVNLCKSVLSNLDGCRKHWQKVIDAEVGVYPKHDKAKCKGFLRQWKQGGVMEWLTAFMLDVCSVFRYIEKETQKPHIIMPDILRYRNIALQKLSLLSTTPYPGICIPFDKI